MAEVRASSGVPVVGAFAGLGAPTVCAPVVVDSATGDIYTLKTGDIVVKAGAGGTVTSVGISAPTEITVGSSPITSSGIIALTWAAQSAGYIFSGPISGANATPTFKKLTSFNAKTSDTSRNNTTVLANDPDLLFSIDANQTWFGRTFIDVHSGIKTTGIKVTIAAPTGASGTIHCAIFTDATSGNVNSVLNTNTLGAALDFTAASFPATVTTGFMEILWQVVNGANAGNISLQWCQSTSSATALIIGQGSQMIGNRTA